MTQTEYFGFNSIKNLKSILEQEKARNIFLVTGKKSYETCGAKKSIEEIFNETKCDFIRFPEFSPNPKLEQIQKGVCLFGENNYDAIIAVGGGSVIDVAKAVKLFSKKREIPLIAIPTTAGSGSEATHFIVYYKDKIKQSIGTPEITLPNYFICDPELTLALPKKITACTGMDALAQAIESYWSIHSTIQSKKYSKEAIKISLSNLEDAVNNPTEYSKEKVMKAANIAGKAINIARTTACHSISYPITSYFKVAHGHAVGLTLGEMIEYNSSRTAKENCNDERGPNYVVQTMKKLIKILNVKNPHQAKEKIKNLMENIGLQTKLSDLGLLKEDIELIVEKGFNKQRVKNNPRLLTKENLRKILKKIY